MTVPTKLPRFSINQKQRPVLVNEIVEVKATKNNILKILSREKGTSLKIKDKA